MKRIRIGIVGLNFGRHVVDTLVTGTARRHFVVAGLCDTNTVRVQSVAARTGAVVFPTLAAMLAARDIDAIGLFTGPHGRADLLRLCLKAGKHVMTTKPFEFSIDGAREVLALARRLGLVLHLNSPGATDSAEMRGIVAWQNKYGLGSLVGLHGEAWGSYNEKADGSWYDDPALCPLAPVLRLGIYLVHDMIRLAGPAVSVQASATRVRTGRPTADNAQLTLRFGNGALGSIYSSLCVDDGQPYRNGLRLNFERGTIRRNQGLNQSDPSQRSELTLNHCNERGRKVGMRRAWRELSGDYQWLEFARCLRRREPLSAAVEKQVIAGVAIVGALSEAEQKGTTVLIPSWADVHGKTAT